MNVQKKDSLLEGIEPQTFRLTAERSANWAKEADDLNSPKFIENDK